MRASLAALGAAAVLLSGCDTTMPWSSTRDPGGPDGHASLVVTPTTLTFSALEGAARPAIKSASVTVTGTVYVQVQSAGAAIQSATLVQSTPSSGNVVVTPVLPTAAGNLAGTVTVLGCLDPQCNTHAAGSPATISVSYDVSARTLTTSPTAIAVDHVQGAAAPAPISLALTDSAGGGYTAAVSYSGYPSGWLSLDKTAGTSFPDTIAVSVNPAGRSPGTYTATITITSAGGSRAVPVTFTVRRPELHAAPASIPFAAVTSQTSLPATTSLDLTTDGGVPVSFTATITYGPGATGWLTSVAGGTAPVTRSVGVNTTSLAPGSYQATVVLSPSNGAPSVSLPVTYAVSPRSLQVSPASASFTVTAATTAAELVQTLGVSDAGTTLVYSASSTAPWLAVSPSTGATGADPDLVLSIVVPQLATLADATYAATVLVGYQEPSGAAIELRLPVTLALSLPRVRSVSPHVVVAGAEGEVVVRGTGLAGAGSVLFDAATATTFTVISATELRVTPPALASGTHTVRVPNAVGLDSTAALAAVDPVTRASASIVSTGSKTRVVFDDAREAIYVAATDTLERYRAANAWARETLALAKLRDVALSPDGARLVAVADTSIWEIDPDAFTLPAQATATTGGYFPDSLWRLAFANDGTGVLAPVGHPSASGYFPCRKYDYWTKTTAALSCSLYFGGVGGSADGRRVVVLGTSSDQIAQYDASTRTFSVSSVVANFSEVALDRAATRAVLFYPGGASSIRDASYAHLGALPTGLARAILSSDGTRAYAWDSTAGKVRIFDLAAAPVAGIYPELGTAGGTAPVASPGAVVRMTVSADGRTLVLAGDQSIVLFPLP